MAAPQITPLPTPPSRSDDPSNFSQKGDAFLGALPSFGTQANAVATFVNQKASEVDVDAASALASRNTATAAAAQALQSAQTATATNKSWPTYALAAAAFASMSNGQVIFVAVDETRGSMGAYYRATGTPVTSLTFLRMEDQYTSDVSYLPNMGVKEALSRLFVAAGIIPDQPPSLSLDFVRGEYKCME